MIPYTDERGNLRHYFPDFVVVDTDGNHYLVETKGIDSKEVEQKDLAAALWAASATELTHTNWRYLKVLQKDFEKHQPSEFIDLVHLNSVQ
jgi:hypothetical protein